MNDSLRTNVFVRFSPDKIACACIYLAARKFQVLKFRLILDYVIVGSDCTAGQSWMVVDVWGIKT